MCPRGLMVSLFFPSRPPKLQSSAGTNLHFRNQLVFAARSPRKVEVKCSSENEEGDNLLEGETL